MSDTKPEHVIEWLRSESGRASQQRAEKNDDGGWKNSARRRSTLFKRAYMLRRAASLLEGDYER